MNRNYERIKARRKKDPWYRPLEYAKRRCSDEKHKEYHRYGGRGIICILTYPEARTLYERDNGHLLKQPSLDREDPDGNYEFGNCRYIERVDNVARARPSGMAASMESLCATTTGGEWD